MWRCRFCDCPSMDKSAFGSCALTLSIQRRASEDSLESWPTEGKLLLDGEYYMAIGKSAWKDRRDSTSDYVCGMKYDDYDETTIAFERTEYHKHQKMYNLKVTRNPISRRPESWCAPSVSPGRTETCVCAYSSAHCGYCEIVLDRAEATARARDLHTLFIPRTHAACMHRAQERVFGHAHKQRKGHGLESGMVLHACCYGRRNLFN